MRGGTLLAMLLILIGLGMVIAGVGGRAREVLAVLKK